MIVIYKDWSVSVTVKVTDRDCKGFDQEEAVFSPLGWRLWSLSTDIGFFTLVLTMECPFGEMQKHIQRLKDLNHDVISYECSNNDIRIDTEP